MRYTQLLLDRIRRHTGNVGTPTTTDMVENQAIIDYLNDAIALIQSIIYPEMPEFFNITEEISIAAQTASYTLNGATFFGDTIAGVEYSYDGSVNHYAPLRRISPIERNTEYISTPKFYYIQGGSVFLSGVPNTAQGKIRVTYTRMANKIDIRRGKVSSTTDDGTYYLTIVLAASGPAPVTADFTDRAESENVTIVDADGVIQHANIPFSSYSGTTVTLPGSTVLISDGTISANDYLVFGEYATTHSELPIQFEAFLVQYAIRQILANEESSIDVASNDPVLRSWVEGIVNSAQNIQNVYDFPAQIDACYA